MTTCPCCGAERGHLLGCERSPFTAPPPPASALPAEPVRRHRALAIPAALGAMGLLSLTGPGAFLLRVLFGMWLHEAGHAVASWVCGVVAVPLPWLTLSGEGRSWLFVLVLFASLAGLARRFWVSGHRSLAAVALLSIAAVLVGVTVPFRHATTFIVFAGDGGALVFGTGLMLLFLLLPEAARLARGGLRWGYLAIGAGAFVDTLGTWVRAWRDVAELPFGRSEASGLSDALRLVETSGWSERLLVNAYLGLGVCCLLVLTAVTARRLLTS